MSIGSDKLVAISIFLFVAALLAAAVVVMLRS